MVIALVIVSILLLTVSVRGANKFLPFKICPICAGVSGTWLWMLLGVVIGKLSLVSFQLPTAVLMGGSVVGIAYQLEKKLPKNRSDLLWKTIFIPTGFAAVYEAVSLDWSLFSMMVALIGLIFLFFFRFGMENHLSGSETVEKLEKEMEKCC